MKYIFIVNPVAGKGKLYNEITEKIESVRKNVTADCSVYITKSAGDATEFVKTTARECGDEEIAFFACGGDGTLCEVANGIMACENRDRLYLGTVPAGTGNDFVRNFTSAELFSDISAQIDGTPMKIDLLRCNDFYSVNMVNIGFDCEVVCRKEEIQKHKAFPPKLAYVVGIVLTLIKKPGLNCKISVDGGEYEDKALLLTTLGNGEYCGGGFHSNPESMVNNGKVNHLCVNNISRMKFISIVGSYQKGTHLVYTDIVSSKLADSIDLKFDKTTNISVDGELVRVDSLSVRCVKDAVNFLLPAGCEYKGNPAKSESSEKPVEATV